MTADPTPATGERTTSETTGAGLRERVAALADEWEEWARLRSTPRINAFRDAAERIRALLAETPTEDEGAIKAAVLREAADAAVPLFNVHPLNRSNAVADWLRDRADRMEASQ